MRRGWERSIDESKGGEEGRGRGMKRRGGREEGREGRRGEG